MNASNDPCVAAATYACKRVISAVFPQKRCAYPTLESAPDVANVSIELFETQSKFSETVSLASYTTSSRTH